MTLVLLTGVSALNLNIVLPSLPGLAAHYGANYGVAALAISAYVGLTAALQLVIGPLSDRLGRRPVILAGLAIFLLATVGCMLAPTIEAFLAFRLLQASVVVGIALSRAIVRDMVPTERAASLIGYVTMGMSLVPMVGPMIGGLLDEAFGWQSFFAFTLAFGVAVTALIWADLGEFNLAPSQSLAAQVRPYPDLIRSRRFWGYSLTAPLASGAFFAFLGGGPWVASELLGMSTLGARPALRLRRRRLRARQCPIWPLRAGCGHEPDDAGGRHCLDRGRRARPGALRAGAGDAPELLRGDHGRRGRQPTDAAERQRRRGLGPAAPRRLGLGARGRDDDRRRRAAVGGRRSGRGAAPGRSSRSCSPARASASSRRST